MPTKIEWATETWDIVEGCTKVSEGCRNCYAERLAKRARRDFSKVELQPQRLDQPRHWRGSRDVFVCSRSDPFHPKVPSQFLWHAFEVMRETPQHRYLLLTKRPELAYTTWNWPENVWLGVSGEDQENATRRLNELVQVGQSNQVAHLFLSAEPLLGPLDLTPWLDWCICGHHKDEHRARCPHNDGCLFYKPGGSKLHWVIVGGESRGSAGRALVEVRCSRCGQPEAAHGVADDACQRYWAASQVWTPKAQAATWVRDIIRQCQEARVPVFFKQWPIPPHRPGGRAEIDGREWRQRPA